MNTESKGEAPLVSAFDRSTWDEETETYFKLVGDVWRDKHDMPFHNGRPLHAAYLTHKFFSKAKTNVRLFSGELIRVMKGGPDDNMPFYSDPHIIAAIRGFLTRDDTELKIVVENDVDVDQGQTIEAHPLMEAISSWKASGELKGRCELRKVSPDVIKNMKERKTHVHMLIMDNLAYRIEVDIEKQEAFVNVNDTELADNLIVFFDNGLYGQGEALWSA